MTYICLSTTTHFLPHKAQLFPLSHNISIRSPFFHKCFWSTTSGMQCRQGLPLPPAGSNSTATYTSKPDLLVLAEHSIGWLGTCLFWIRAIENSKNGVVCYQAKNDPRIWRHGTLSPRQFVNNITEFRDSCFWWRFCLSLLGWICFGIIDASPDKSGCFPIGADQVENASKEDL